MALASWGTGMAASPDDGTLALRGLKTLGVRLEALERSTLEVAKWLAQRPEIETVLHPALPSCPGHDDWRWDFKDPGASLDRVRFDLHCRAGGRFVDGLSLFKIGYSWGGVTSLVMPYPPAGSSWQQYEGRIVRLNSSLGLEHQADLIDDLTGALAGLHQSLVRKLP